MDFFLINWTLSILDRVSCFNIHWVTSLHFTHAHRSLQLWCPYQSCTCIMCMGDWVVSGQIWCLRLPIAIVGLLFPELPPSSRLNLDRGYSEDWNGQCVQMIVEVLEDCHLLTGRKLKFIFLEAVSLVNSDGCQSMCSKTSADFFLLVMQGWVTSGVKSCQS